VAAGSTFEAYINRLGIGADGYGARGLLDLRGATVQGGVLRMGSLVMGNVGWGGSVNRTMAIALDNATALSRIEVTNAMDMGVQQAHLTWIGNPGSNTNLPPNIDVAVGVNVAGRGKIRLAIDAWPYCFGRMVASSNGTFTAYLTEFDVGGSGMGGSCDAIWDFSAMTNMVLDCTGIVNVPYGDTWASSYSARLKLPPGNGITKDLRLGVPSSPRARACCTWRRRGSR